MDLRCASPEVTPLRARDAAISYLKARPSLGRGGLHPYACLRGARRWPLVPRPIHPSVGGAARFGAIGEIISITRRIRDLLRGGALAPLTEEWPRRDSRIEFFAHTTVDPAVATALRARRRSIRSLAARRGERRPEERPWRRLSPASNDRAGCRGRRRQTHTSPPAGSARNFALLPGWRTAGFAELLRPQSSVTTIYAARGKRSCACPPTRCISNGRLPMRVEEARTARARLEGCARQVRSLRTISGASLRAMRPS